MGTGDGKKATTATYRVGDALSRDGAHFPWRKLAGFCILVAGLFLIVSHASHHHDEGEGHPTWVGWALLGLGGLDLGLQSAGVILKHFANRQGNH